MRNKIFYLAITGFVATIMIAENLQAQSPLSKPELNEKYHQFDFWLGEWDVYKYGSETLVGQSHIMSINDSTGILENYNTIKGPYKGKSLNTFNQKTGFWEQYWIDNGSLVLKLFGQLKEGKMIMLSFEGVNGNKITWSPLDGKVRQTWEVTKDGGKTWSNVFDGLYVKR